MALLTDLEDRGMLEETLVVFLTEFGRTQINGPQDVITIPMYSVALAGGGIKGGHIYGSSTSGAYPRNNPATPGDLHATIFNTLGIHHNSEISDQRPAHSDLRREPLTTLTGVPFQHLYSSLNTG